MKKNKIKVIRSAGKTIVIYSEQPAGKKATPKMGQRPILVRVLGQRSYYVMPDGSTLPVRLGRFWKFIKIIRPQSRFAI